MRAFYLPKKKDDAAPVDPPVPPVSEWAKDEAKPPAVTGAPPRQGTTKVQYDVAMAHGVEMYPGVRSDEQLCLVPNHRSCRRTGGAQGP